MTPDPRLLHPDEVARLVAQYRSGQPPQPYNDRQALADHIEALQALVTAGPGPSDCPCQWPNTEGHGHVHPRPFKARCGGIAFCPDCQAESRQHKSARSR